MGQTEWAGGLSARAFLPEPPLPRPQDAADVEWRCSLKASHLSAREGLTLPVQLCLHLLQGCIFYLTAQVRTSELSLKPGHSASHPTPPHLPEAPSLAFSPSQCLLGSFLPSFAFALLLQNQEPDYPQFHTAVSWHCDLLTRLAATHAPSIWLEPPGSSSSRYV